MGRHESPGVLVELGRIVAGRNAFCRCLFGVAMSAGTASIATTMRLTGITFSVW